MSRGGKRDGAGVKTGSMRPNFNAFWSIREIEEYMIYLKENYKNSPELTKYVGDHLFGKAVQPLGNEERDGKQTPLLVKFIS